MSDTLVAAAHSRERAIRFLLGSRQIPSQGAAQAHQEHESRCHWRDFSVLGRTSDEWVTAYTAAALASTGIAEARDAADTAWRYLTRKRPDFAPGLGYNQEAPRDADSTQWGCRLSVLLGRTSEDWFRRAIEFLAGPQEVHRACLRPDGGLATYPSLDSFPIEIRKSAEGAALGWTSSHACVTAATAWLKEILAFGDLIGFLSRTQSSQGCWQSYWWMDPEYATAHALECLARHALQQDSINRGTAWLEGRPLRASGFQLALRIIGISAANPGRADGLLPMLLSLQRDDGSWPPSASMRIPPLDLRDPDIRWNWDESSDGFGGIVVDHARIFTTATAVRALTSCLVR